MFIENYSLESQIFTTDNIDAQPKIHLLLESRRTLFPRATQIAVALTILSCPGKILPPTSAPSVTCTIGQFIGTC